MHAQYSVINGKKLGKIWLRLCYSASANSWF